MKNIDRVKIHDDFVKIYDSQAKEYNSYGHEVLFGMCYEYAEAGDTLLDLGIGTGLSSVNFAQAGLVVHGMDASAAMLEECRKKGFAKELKEHSITDTPLPYKDNSFSHVICCGVYHFFGDLQPFIAEASRLVRENGVFGFTIASIAPEDLKSASGDTKDYIEVMSPWDVPIFKHSDEYIQAITKDNGFEIQKKQKILAETGDMGGDDILFKSIVARKGK
jgi:predicted TPR repeat methyltransferase